MAGWKYQALDYIVPKLLFHEKFIVCFKFILLNFLKIHLLIVVEEGMKVSHFFISAMGHILLSLFIVSPTRL